MNKTTGTRVLADYETFAGISIRKIEVLTSILGPYYVGTSNIREKKLKLSNIYN